MPKERLTRRTLLKLSGTAAAATQLVATPDAALAAEPVSPAGTGATQLTIARVSATSAQASYPATKVIDGDASTNPGRWLNLASDTQPVLTLELAEAAEVGQLGLISGYMNSAGYDPFSAVNSFRVEAEVDGAWVAVAEVQGNDQLVRQVPFEPVTTQRVRLVITQPSSQSDSVARVFEVYLLSARRPVPLRHLPKPNLRFHTRARIANESYQVTFYEATWDGGMAIVHDLAARIGPEWVPVNTAAQRFDEQWVLLRGDRGTEFDYYNTMDPWWIAFDTLTPVDGRSVELRGNDPGFGDFRLTWDLHGARPRLTYQLTAAQSSEYVVGYQSFNGRQLAAVDEVLCGPLQHAKVVLDRAAWGTWKLTAPFTLTEHRVAGKPFTVGVFVPADQIPFENDHHLGVANQRYGMCLRDDDDLVRPVLFEPQVGQRSPMAAGQTRTFAVGLVAEPVALTGMYEQLLRSEYRYHDYRENIFGASMTDTMYNLIDLIMTESGQDDSVDFRPSPSGWWNRAKGFIDIENDEAVRTTSACVLLEAFLLTGDDAVYDRRALPTIEFHVSRNGYGWTPKKGNPVYGDRTLYKVGSVPFDASTLAPLYRMTGEWNKGIQALAVSKSNTPDDYWLKRTPWSTPLALYRMTGDHSHLRDAEAAAHDYLKSELDRPYETNVEPADFQYYYSKAWTELLELYEATGKKRYLDAAHAEARRYVTQVFVRPVPDTTVTAPTAPIRNQSADWSPSARWAYPQTTVTPEEAPAWLVSTNGATFEALGTYDNLGGGYTLNPAWAPFLLRLAAHTGDALLADVANNAIVGRYTNYPGYYNRQFMPQQAHPDFPLQGPPGIGAIYYSHIPVQLGMTIDWLVSEQAARSRGAIDFPAEFEADYVWFKYHTYGHRPGRFYGEDDVWLWMPRGIVTVDSPQVNWVSAEGNGRLYLSLTNASPRTQQISLSFGETQAGIRRDRDYHAWVIRDNGRREPAVVHEGRLVTSVSPKGITAVVVDGVHLDVALHRRRRPTSGGRSFHLDDDSPIGIVRGMLLVKPGLSRYDAYIQAATESPATLHYSTDGGQTYTAISDKPYPNEWTVPVSDLHRDFAYYVEAGGLSTGVTTLSLGE